MREITDRRRAEAQDGRLMKWYGTNTDIHDSKEANPDLRRSEAFLAQGQRLTMTGSIWWRPLTDDMFFGRRERSVLLNTASMKNQRSSWMLSRCHPEDVEQLQSTVAQLNTVGSPADFEYSPTHGRRSHQAICTPSFRTWEARRRLRDIRRDNRYYGAQNRRGQAASQRNASALPDRR